MTCHTTRCTRAHPLYGMADSSMETGVSCGQLVCAAVLPCSILMDERSEFDNLMASPGPTLGLAR